MIIRPYGTYNTSFGGKRIPLKDYLAKGLPVLKLTPEEDAKIKLLEAELRDVNIQLIKLKLKYSGKRARTEKLDNCNSVCDTLEQVVESLRTQIDTIKRNRRDTQILNAAQNVKNEDI